MAAAKTPEKPTASINFKNNCIICLLPEVPAKMLELLQTNPKNLQSFQPIVHYLTGTDPTFGKSQEECAAKDLPLMKNLPPLCTRCYDTAAVIYSMHTQLLELELMIQKNTEALRKLVSNTRRGKSTKKSDKNLFLIRLRSYGMSEEQVEGMSKFVDNFHGHIISEASNKVKFPSFPPPNFIPLPKLPVRPVVLLQIPVQQLQQVQSQIPPAPATTAASLTPTSVIPRVKPIATTTTITSNPSPLVRPSSSNVSNGTGKPNAVSKVVQRKPPILIKSAQSLSTATVSARAAAPITASSCSVAVTTSRDQVAKAVTTSLTTSTTKSDIIVLPGKSATVKFENEMEDEEEEVEDDVQETMKLEPEVIIKEEPRDEMIFADEDDVPPPPNNDEDTSDEDWEMEEDDDGSSDKTESGDNEDDNDLDDNETSRRSRLSKKNIGCRRQPQLSTPTKAHSKQVKQPSSSSAPVRILPKILPQRQPVIVTDQMATSLGVHVTASRTSSTITTPINPPTAPALSAAVDQPQGSSRRKQVLLTKDQQLQLQISKQPMDKKVKPPGKFCINGSYYKPKVKDKLECDVCNILLQTNELPAHIRTHLGGEDGHLCPACRRVFISRSKLLQHWQVRYCTRNLLNQNIYFDDNIICTTCPSTPGQLPVKYSLLEFRKHVFLTHERDTNLARIHQCVFCQLKFRSDHGLDFHLNVHCHPVRRYNPGHWDICPPGTRTRAVYIKCDICKKSYRWNDLEEHIRSKHGLSFDSLVRCVLCTFFSTKVETYLNHLNETHGSEDDHITCHLCGTSFDTTPHLRVHFIQSHGLETPPFCDLCATHFPNEESLDSHLKICHNPDNDECSQQKFVCKRCPPDKQINYKSMEILRQHLKKCHSQSRFKCHRCFRGFESRFLLRCHEKTDHDKPIDCGLCEKKFIFQQTYFQHMNAVHWRKQRIK